MPYAHGMISTHRRECEFGGVNSGRGSNNVFECGKVIGIGYCRQMWRRGRSRAMEESGINLDVEVVESIIEWKDAESRGSRVLCILPKCQAKMLQLPFLINLFGIIKQE